MVSSGTGDGSRRRTKVAALIHEYELGESFGERLETLWTQTENRRSLRELADLFNKELLASTLVSARRIDR
ncbi:rod-determining factor RdfA [Natrinema halophilum]|uniref:rod-determining factor RdfA n=1 Tax=Natrinema halophilum TaxID=1699371 RepID=UPI0031BB1903